MSRANFADPDGIRRWLRERDGDNCALCGEPIDFTLAPAGRTHGRSMGVSIDHIIPRAAGGSDDFTNLQLAHGPCNRRKGSGRAGVSAGGRGWCSASAG
jgi:5-methylcytosine-specific restriction endonuclease McrA